jgi:hypothetical protein
MDMDRLDSMARVLGRQRNRRGAVAALAGLGLAVLAHPGDARKRRTRRAGRRNRVAAQAAPSGAFVEEGDSDATSLVVLAHFDSRPLWDHTDLTATVHAGGNADPALVAAIRAAIRIWGDVLDRHFDGVVTLTDVTDDHKRAVKADMRVHFIPHWGSYKFAGQAKCKDDRCLNIYVKSEWPPAACCKELNETVWKVTPEIIGQLALHELGHALGLGHADPLETTNDIMGYGFLPWILTLVRDPVISTCDLKVLDEVFAWRVEGSTPRRPAVAEVVC